MQPRCLNGNAATADLLLGFEPITERIAFPSGLKALLENLICPLPDLRVRTEADHRFLLPVWLTDGTSGASTSGTFSAGSDKPRTYERDCSDIHGRDGLLTVAFFPFRKVFFGELPETGTLAASVAPNRANLSRRAFPRVGDYTLECA